MRAGTRIPPRGAISQRHSPICVKSYTGCFRFQTCPERVEFSRNQVPIWFGVGGVRQQTRQFPSRPSVRRLARASIQTSHEDHGRLTRDPRLDIEYDTRIPVVVVPLLNDHIMISNSFDFGMDRMTTHIDRNRESRGFDVRVRYVRHDEPSE